MALFQFNGRIIPYKIQLAPFAFDLVLLQGSKFTGDFWRPVLQDMEKRTNSGGRLLTCDWADQALDDKRVTEDFVKLLQTLSLTSVRVVAFDDAVELVAEAQLLVPGLFDKTLFFPEGGPKGDELTRAVRELCHLEA